MAHVCPWWFVRSFDNPIRRLLYDPEQIFGDWVRPGMHVLDIGCGAGFNSEGLARLVGPDGLVVAVDLQAHMLAMTRRRLERGGLAERAEFVKFSANDLRLSREPRFGFAVAFSMDHKFRTLRSCSNGCERRSTRAHPCLLSSPKSMSEETRSKPA